MLNKVMAAIRGDTMGNLVFVDAECDGLYGPFLSVAMLAVDENGVEQERLYCGVSDRLLQEVKSEWVKEHVLPHMGDYIVCDSEQELLDHVWCFWVSYLPDCRACADVAYPVEQRLFARCVEEDREIRAQFAPFPLLDLSSMLYAKGIDPLKSRYELLGLPQSELQHNAMEDVEIAVQVWRTLILEQE